MPKPTLGSHIIVRSEESDIQLDFGPRRIEFKIKGIDDLKVNDFLKQLVSMDIELKEGYGQHAITGLVDHVLAASNSSGVNYEFHTADLELPSIAKQIFDEVQELSEKEPDYRSGFTL